MNRTMVFTLLLSGSFAGRAHCETHALATDFPAPVGAYDKTILLSDTALWRDSGNLVAGNSVTDKAIVPGRMGADTPAPPFVASLRWATCASSVHRGRPYWFWQ